MSINKPTVREALLSNEIRSSTTQAEYESNLFRRLVLGNGVIKTTSPGRLDDLNQVVNALLPSKSRLTLMDAAVSSGVSTLEWMDSLDLKNIKYDITAGDITIFAAHISWGHCFHFSIDQYNTPIQYEVCGRAIPSRATGISGLLPRLLNLLAKLLTRRNRHIISSFTIASSNPVPGKMKVKIQSVKLLTRSLQTAHNLILIEDDITQPVPSGLIGRFDVVRAANIVQSRYFSKETMKKIIANLGARLVPGGLLIICRTHKEGSNHASIFKLTRNNTFTVLERLNNGSEIEGLVLDYPYLNSRTQH